MGASGTWLDAGRIGRSDLARLAFEGSREDPAWDVGGWLTAMIETFAMGRCRDLADAVALASGLEVASLLGEGGALVHAAAYDRAADVAFDVLGARDLATLRGELAGSFGALEVVLEAPRRLEGAWATELREVAFGLPWVPRPRGVPATPLATLRGFGGGAWDEGGGRRTVG